MESASTSANQGRLNQDIENFQEEQQAAEEEGRSVVVSYCCFVVLLSFCHFVGAFFVSVCFCENCYWYLKVIKAKVKVQLYLRVILFESDQVSNYKA